MKFTYWVKGEMTHAEIKSRVDMIVHPIPAAPLMIFRNPISNDWTVSEYKTGALIQRCFKTRKAAKEFCTFEIAMKVQLAIDLNAKNGNAIPVVN